MKAQTKPVVNESVLEGPGLPQSSTERTSTFEGPHSSLWSAKWWLECGIPANKSKSNPGEIYIYLGLGLETTTESLHYKLSAWS